MQYNNSFKRRFNLNQYIINANFLQNYGRKKNLTCLGWSTPQWNRYCELKNKPAKFKWGCWSLNRIGQQKCSQELAGSPWEHKCCSTDAFNCFPRKFSTGQSSRVRPDPLVCDEKSIFQFDVLPFLHNLLSFSEKNYYDIASSKQSELRAKRAAHFVSEMRFLPIRPNFFCYIWGPYTSCQTFRFWVLNMSFFWSEFDETRN